MALSLRCVVFWKDSEAAPMGRSLRVVEEDDLNNTGPSHHACRAIFFMAIVFRHSGNSVITKRGISLYV